MIRSFADRGTEDIYDGNNTPIARRTCPELLWKIARRKLDQLNQAQRLDDLKAPPANRLEALKGKREGEHSLRINDQYRICFVWTAEGPEGVGIEDYH